MDPKKYLSLSEREQHMVFLSMHIRNKLEDFHCKHLNDDQMKELNQTVRKAIIEALIIEDKGLEEISEIQKSNKIPSTFQENYWAHMYYFTVSMIPEYWEIPTEEEAMENLEAEHLKLKDLQNTNLSKGKNE